MRVPFGPVGQREKGDEEWEEALLNERCVGSHPSSCSASYFSQSVAVMNTMAKGQTEGFILAYSLLSIVKGSQGRGIEAGTEVEAIEEGWLLACSP